MVGPGMYAQPIPKKRHPRADTPVDEPGLGGSRKEPSLTNINYGRKFVLIRTYNLAYVPWLRACLKQKRIMGDREYSWKEAQNILMDMDARGSTMNSSNTTFRIGASIRNTNQPTSTS
jgi:hypothetical protein